MLREFKSANRNSTKAPEEAENVPVSAKDSVLGNVVTDETRAPLVVIQEPQSLTTPVRDRSKSDRTPKGKCGENGMKTPEKFGGFSSRNRFGWGQKSEAGTGVESGNLFNVTPRSMRSLGRTSSGVEGNVVHLTPTKSVNKPPTVRKVEGNGRVGMFAGLYRGLTGAPFQPSGVNSVEVPHFDLKEDPSFWMDHNVQVLIRIRPLNEMEKRIQGYSRCLKQESAQTITWIGPPETRFTFDHVACETVDQETLFRTAGLPMVENCLSGYNSCMFAYGQTGSGKTYTMLGEIDQLEINPSPHRGMTPRVFEFLFARIRAEEETRKEEKLKYSCKCSFLEIYNEQITDLLDPSATNLHLREDMKKGVYVENLAEFEVQTVSDILLLLSQGASNRKVAATNMNRESSRSHSVFTCVIESQWEKDATTNLRFARLNLVDLAGSERQKTSGAEGDRLKEAASINKSLSTLGHVIMVLLEVAHGKPKHVPYRDSKLTFLLQDSLGGNSKTMIIANVSSATCCATETLNTLKFAQRAKLIQNNAVVNEDSSGDVGALQQQIRILKEELVALKRHNVSRSLSFGKDTAEDSMSSKYSCKEDDMQKATDLMVETESKGTLRMSCKQFKSMETTLAGSLRREQMAESSIKQLEAEIEHLNRLVRQREEDARSTKMMLKFRDDKISRMESLVNNVIPVDSYLFQENKALYEEIQLLTAKLDRNPEVTRFALENIRLLDQIRRFQDFYKEGEKEMLLSEISELRKQLFQRLDGDTMQPCSPHVKTITKDGIHDTNGNRSLNLELKHTSSELEECKSNLRSCLEENAKLSRDIGALQTQLNLLRSNIDEDELNFLEISSKSPTENYNDSKSSINKTEDLLNVQLELDVFKVILQEEILCRRETEEKAMNFMNSLELARENLSLITMQYTDTKRALQNSKSVVEALESQQIFLINEIDDLKTSNDSVLELLHKKEAEILDLKEQVSGHEHSRALSLSRNYENKELPLQTKLTKMQDSLEKAKSLNTWYQKDLVNQTTSSEEMEKIRRQAEVETAEVIVCLQEELSVLQQHIDERNLLEMEQQKKFKLLEDESKELQQKLLVVTQERNMLDEQLKQKEGEIKTLWDEWKLLTSAIEEVLYEGNESLVDASSDVAQISNSLPGKRSWISEQIGQMAKIKSEKENLVEELRRSLEDANFQISNLDCMLRSLKGAALAINDSHQKELGKKEKEVERLTSQLSEKSNSMEKMNNDIQLSKGYIKKLYACATAGFVIVNNFSQTKSDLLEDIKQKDAIINEMEQSSKTNCELAANQAVAIVEANKKICFLQKELNNVKDKCKELDNVLDNEKAQACFMMKKLQEFEANEMLKTKDKLAELQAGVSSVMSSFGMRYSTDSSSTNGREGTDTTNRLLAEGVDTDTSMCSSNIPRSTEIKVLESVSTPHEASRKGYTMSLLRKEIQSALESLEAINLEMAKLRHEKEKAVISESKSQKNMECLKDQVIALETAMSVFEERTGFKMALVQDKLQNVEILVEDTNTCWSKTKELFETEALSMSNRFDESQGALREADIMINKLMITNEAMNGEMEALNKERMVLVHEIQSLKSTNDMLSQQLELLEKQFEKHLTDAKGAILELEDNVIQVQDQIQDDFQSLICDFSGLKNHLMHAKNLMHSSFEDIWSELIVKDCVVSVLHLCHSGLLLETVMRKNVENCLLQHELSEQHSVIADLKKHNNLSRRGIDMCRAVEGKMLTDIRKSFDRVLKKEEETEQLDLKLITFERTILDLQAQEELMLQRSDAMGCELAKLMKELDKSNSSAMTALLEHDKLLKDKQECINYQNEVFLVEMLSKDVETLVWASKLKELALDAADSELEKIRCLAISENMKEELVLNGVDGHLKGLLIEDLLNELSIQTRAGKILENERNNLSSLLIENKLSHRKMSEEMELRRLKDVSHSNDVFKKEMDEATELKWSLLSEIHALKSEHDTFSRELKENDAALELSSIIISYLCQKNQKLEEKVDLLKVTSCEIQSQLEMTESTIGGLQSNMSIKEAELDELHQYQSALLKELSQKSEDHLLLTDRNRALLEDFHLLKSELSKLSLVNTKSSEKMENAVDMSSIINSNLNQGIVSVAEKLLEEMNYSVEMASQFMKELVCVEDYASSLLFTNESLHTELLRKDEIVKVLLSDLSLLQESTSNTENYKDDLDKMLDSLKDFQEELAKKTADNDELMSKYKTQEAQLQDKNAVISTLQMHIEEANEKLQMLSHEKAELIVQLEDGIAQKCSIEEELVEKKAIIDGLESELLRMNSTLNEACSTIESMQENLDVVISERDHLHSNVLLLEEKLDMAEAQVQETEAIATEAKQMAESEKFYLAVKEEEIKLLERSIEELESTIDVLEDKVEMVKGEAERQRLQREELEIELHALKNQMLSVESCNTDIRRHLNEKEMGLEETLQRVKILEIDLDNKDTEIARLKTHISELNVHAEAQACEYKQKFKALESMAEKVRLEGSSGPGTGSSSNKLERNSSKPRGSGSPFKCIGLGLVQQMKSEKDEDLTDARRHIAELEALAASRQKEIFMLNSRLAAAESMTHDVIRELLGVKLDMTQYASLLDADQVHKLTEKALLHNEEPQMKDTEVAKLKQQLNGLIEERKGWLDEIDRKQAELLAAQVSLEKLHQTNRLLKAENNTFKIENASHKKQVTDLENQVNKLSGQQNLQQRIHHHAKVKEENNFLRTQNEELSLKLRRAENILSRVKEELAAYRASVGKSRYINFDDQERLQDKLKETEEEKLQLAQNLLALCTNILKVAGITSPVSDITILEAEEALGHLKNKITSLERDIEDLKLKNKITLEKARLSELMPQLPPLSPMSEDKSRTPGRLCNAPFFSTLDR